MLLTTPIWLFALAAIGIPVVIHLWNIKPGKTLKVGSISLFSEASPKSSRSFKLLDILLLILRCLLLSVLALLLAAPLWQQHLKTVKAKGWVLIPKAYFNQTYQRYKTTIDSFNSAGYEFHYFDKDFARVNLNQLLQQPIKDSTGSSPANYWGLTRQLAQQLPANVPAELFTPNTINHFAGNKPASALKLNWHTFTPADSVSNWLAVAWLTPSGSIRAIQGIATPAGITYQYHDIKNGGQAGTGYAVSLDNGLPVVTFNQTKTTVDTATQHIVIYSDKNLLDAGYLKAALDAGTQLTQRKTAIKIYNRADAIPTGQQWLFWLADRPADQRIVQKTKNIFSYVAGKAVDETSWINSTDSYTIAQGQTTVPLTKIIAAQTATGNALWSDGFGHPVLSINQLGATASYYYYSRFNPGWNDLVWSDAFPKWLLTLTNPGKTNDEHERRALQQAQIKPNGATNTIVPVSNPATAIDLSRYLWVIVILLFFTERWLATKNKTELTNG